MDNPFSLPTLTGLFAAFAIWLFTELGSRFVLVQAMPKKLIVFLLGVIFGVLYGLGAHYLGGMDFGPAFQSAATAAIVSLAAVFVDGGIATLPGGQQAKDMLSGKLKPPTGGFSCFLLAFMLLGLLAAGCSRYAVENVEYGYDDAGKVISKNITRIRNTLPAGAKDASQGTLSIAVDPDGAWSMDLGQQSETDLLGTSNAMQGTLGLIYQMAQDNARMQAEMNSLKAAGAAAGSP